MGWKAYVVKDGQVPPESPSLSTSTYASLLEIISPWRNWWWQNPDHDEPDVDADEAKSVLADCEALPSLSEHYQEYMPHLLVFLRYCVDNNLGFIVSF